MQAAANVSPEEIARFGKLAARWWDPDGESRPLHDLNPVRAAYVAGRVDLRNARVDDVGCGRRGRGPAPARTSLVST
jgi:2-polyprenyl-6-hydroxyphenyl methylase/3-demethylubiquinone-9 3-methyltransferase